MNMSEVNKSESRNWIQTADGSWTLWIPEVDETYHSRHGARQESLHVFIQEGLHTFQQPSIKVLEVGMGTGLNVLLTLANKKANVQYHALEPYPLTPLLVEHLINQNPNEASFYKAVHFSEFDVPVEMNDNFTFIKYMETLASFNQDIRFDLIYFDAFGPRVEPDLWTKDALKKCFDLLNPGGVWVSYCAKGEVRRNLVEVGFRVERIPGPPGKREMLRAKK